MGARNEQKARAAIERLHHEGLGPGTGQVVYLNVDLSDPRKAKAAAREFLALESRLDILGMARYMQTRIVLKFDST